MTQSFLPLQSQSVHQIFMCVYTLLAYVPCVNIHTLHTMSSQRQYDFNPSGINSAITVERLYRVEPLTVGQYISHQSLSGALKKTHLFYSPTLSVISAQHTES